MAEQIDTIATVLGRSHPKIEQMMTGAREGLLAFTTFPVSLWKKIWSTNPLERLNKEIKRRTDVVGVVPKPAVPASLAGVVLLETHDECAATDRSYLAEASMAELATPTPHQPALDHPELLTASSTH